MAHYAILNEDNIVINVIVGQDETELIDNLDTETYYSNLFNSIVKRTSYNTVRGLKPDGSKGFRKNYAGIGYSYNEELDAFIPPKPEQGDWKLNIETCLWENIK